MGRARLPGLVGHPHELLARVVHLADGSITSDERNEHKITPREVVW